MKNLLLLPLLALALFSCSEKEDQAINVPQKVKSAFAAKFPQAKRIEWGVEKPGVFEVEFKQNRIESSALLDTTGAILETEVAIKEQDLPATAKATLTKDFARFKFDDFEKTTNAKAEITYEMEAEKGKEEYILTFNASGSLLSKELKKEEKEEKGKGKGKHREQANEEEDQDNAAISTVLEDRFVPQAVRESFATQYPNTKAIWGKEDAGYEAEISINNVATAVVYNLSGACQEIETEIALTNLPAAITETMKRDYSDYAAKEAAEIKLIPSKQTQYEVEVAKGNSHYDLIFNETGKLVDLNILAPAKEETGAIQEGKETAKDGSKTAKAGKEATQEKEAD